MKFLHFGTHQTFSADPSLARFEAEREALGVKVLQSVSPQGWTKFEEIASTLAADKTTPITVNRLQGALTSVLADAMREGYVELNQQGTQAEWKLSEKGSKELRKLQGQQ